MLTAIIGDGDDIHVVFFDLRIIYHDHTVGRIDADTIHTHTAGEHQTVVGVELTELAGADLHIQHDALTHTLIEVCSDKRQPSVAAHAAGAFKGTIEVRTAAEVQGHAFRSEHGLRFLLTLQLPRTASTVEDTLEVHIENYICQIGNGLFIVRLLIRVSVQLTHGLEKQCVAVLLMGCGCGFAFLCGGTVELECVYTILLSAISHNCSRGQFIDPVFCLRHRTTSHFYSGRSAVL